MLEKVSLCVIARNEESVIENLFRDIEKQDYSHEDMEIVLVNSMSTDATRKLMEDFAKKKREKSFAKVLVKDNPKGNQAAGWNVAIESASGDVIIRVDAHAMLPSDFVKKNMSCINSGEYVCGGARPNIAVKKGKWTDMLLAVESSLFGSSIASYRRKDTEKKYVKSIFHGAYRKEVFQKAGLFNENLGRTEDNELHYRIRQAGYKICYDPEIISYQHVRSTWRGMLKQKYGNGFWIGLTSKVCPKCLSVYHFVPFVFVIALLVGIILGATVSWMPFLLLLILYGIFCLFGMISAFIDKGWNIAFLLMPVVFLTLHIAYGVGTIVGFICVVKQKDKK